MKIEPTKIKDCHIVLLDRHDDDRGFFVELFREPGPGPLAGPWLQGSCSRSRKNVVRGLHVTEYAKLVTCVRGRVFDVVIDPRQASPSYGKWIGAELSPENARQVYVPAGCGHGFMALEDETTVVYLQGGQWDPHKEYAVHWRDPTLQIAWPAADAYSLSAKDEKAPPLYHRA